MPSSSANHPHKGRRFSVMKNRIIFLIGEESVVGNPELLARCEAAWAVVKKMETYMDADEVSLEEEDWVQSLKEEFNIT